MSTRMERLELVSTSNTFFTRMRTAHCSIVASRNIATISLTLKCMKFTS